MKKFATKIEKLLLAKLLDLGLQKVDNNTCEFSSVDCVVEISFGAFYNQKSMQFNTGAEIFLFSPLSVVFVE